VLCLRVRVPQLLTCLVRNEGKLILNLLSKIGSIYPQAIYFPIRTLYLTLKIEQRERCTYTVSLGLEFDFLCFILGCMICLYVDVCFVYLGQLIHFPWRWCNKIK